MIVTNQTSPNRCFILFLTNWIDKSQLCLAHSFVYQPSGVRPRNGHCFMTLIDEFTQLPRGISLVSFKYWFIWVTVLSSILGWDIYHLVFHLKIGVIHYTMIIYDSQLLRFTGLKGQSSPETMVFSEVLAGFCWDGQALQEKYRELCLPGVAQHSIMGSNNIGCVCSINTYKSI